MILATVSKAEGDAIMAFLSAFDTELYIGARLRTDYRIFNLIPRD